jgi:phenylacetic acid degradation operon negative regulatory protein
MKHDNRVEQLLEAFRERRPTRAGSLIVTVFGDAIAQHGNQVWMGSLIEALAPFGLNQRLVRTAVYRLCKDDWLASTKIGRRSYYSYSDQGRSQYQKAARRIYALEPQVWDGNWIVVLPAHLKDRERDRLRQQLQWLGFGTLVPGLMAHPSSNRQSLDETLEELDCAHRVVVLKCRTEDLASRNVIRELAWNCWNLELLARRYNEFIQRFSPLLADAEAHGKLTPEQCFQLRILIIHDYRRLLLRDADLPEELLPEDWPGHQASALTARIYRAIQERAEDWLTSQLINAHGPLPAARGEDCARFAGLE